ncbi:hypothetical protein AU468_02090 [Alkalispirochaeta sphaeroplastigenens]|uniref:Uncharacterized protein n=1 Tax=Alkalispirochaeta sphaeroplastigenens TaxID=1187066 RepID=A0A2S4K0K5_9SPIO|nr:hypothetical protein [Alkalispirochaeta sphaeroplastigenens]POR05300.1 hypothetical protein AU468_02090 [Alkalispirochaeta sphaeroplastigenens]
MQTGTLAPPVTLYHLALCDGTSLFLHPFVTRGALLQVTASTPVEGLFGAEPRVEALTHLRNELYRRIEEDVRDWINEKRFIPRFLIASGVFLVVFFFLALVVHTPIPLVDELLGSTAAGVVAFLAVGRHFERSRSASRRRLSLRAKIDGAVFQEHPFVQRLEQVLRRLERAEPTMDSVIGGEDSRFLWEEYPDHTARVVELLRLQITGKPYRALSRAMKQGELPGNLAQAVEEGILHPVMVLLYHEIRRAAPR